MRPCVLAHEEDVAGGEVEDGREVREIARPVSPGGHEAGEISEGALAPDVESAFAGIAGRKLQHGKGERHVEAEPGANPDDDGTGAGGGGGGDPAQADAGDYIEQNEIAEAEHALRAVGISGLRQERFSAGCSHRGAGLCGKQRGEGAAGLHPGFPREAGE